MKRSLPLLAVLVVGACIPTTKSVGEATETEGSTSSDGGSSTGTVPPETGATSIEPPPSTDSTTTATSPGSSDEATETGEPPSFACPPGPTEHQCDVFGQDCPAGFHCIPGTSEGLSLDATVCAPLSDAPVGLYGACSADPTTCSDDCDVGMYCLPSNGLAGPGMCLGMCGEDDAECSADEVCLSCSDCSAGTCAASCDPLDPQCPGDGRCVPTPNGDVACAHWLPEGVGFGEPCFFGADCAEGLFCLDSAMFGEGCELPGCCSDFCDVEDGDPGCSHPGHVCIPYFAPGTAPEGLEHLGACVPPEADPCMVPGNCPPPGIDDTYPWCADSNEEYCTEGGLAGYGNALTCEGGCICHTSCVDAIDCPVPPTGTAVPECLEEPFGPGSATSCMLTCDAGETCPDGMTCSETLTTMSGEALCIWVSPLPPEDC